MFESHLELSRLARCQWGGGEFDRILIHPIFLEDTKVSPFFLRDLVHRTPERRLYTGGSDGFVSVVGDLPLDVRHFTADQILGAAKLDVADLQVGGIGVGSSGLGRMVAAD